MPEIRIRAANVNDHAAAAAIMAQVQQLHIDWRPDIYKPCDEMLPPERFAQLCASQSLYVAEYDGIVAGVMEIQYRHIENPVQVTRDVVYVDSMAVEETYRGKGIGHAFFAFLKALKAEKDFDGIELQVNARNRAAYDMYTHYGFTPKSINMELL